ncbi:MAG: GDP-mannose-dependent alpha-(1-2)-phosphatidylinositol mannosyltransferase [Smithella sp. PtaU1.Bin162]|nr:MAG: GDP-mannose-dependent alpha-(1-2)-phosphatidylinositol mannosyltransferase [Smithella sp. PtaU1.Bin162]
MRVFHFTNNPLSIDQIQTSGNNVNGGSGWTSVLLGRMLQVTDIKFACVARGNVSRTEISQNGRVVCFTIPGQRERCELELCRDLIKDWQPDLIHIHGTENPYGLLTARHMVSCPAVISMQGLLGPCSEWYHYFGNRSLVDIFRMHRWLEFPAFRGHWMRFRKIRKAAKREQEIIRGNNFYMGRTEWDRAYVYAHNPRANYFIENRMIREAFWQQRWDLERMQRHRIIFTNAYHPRKGTELLLDAVKILQPRFPDIKMGIAGAISSRSGYGRYIRRRINELAPAVSELGQLNAQQMAEELIKSHVFVSPSFIDNSPNVVCEAQIVGMPVISTYTGGVPSLIQDRRNGLFFPTGDAPMLAARIREIFEDDELAVNLGIQSRNIARQRHDPDLVLKQVLYVYDTVLKTFSIKQDSHRDRSSR